MTVSNNFLTPALLCVILSAACGSSSKALSDAGPGGDGSSDAGSDAGNPSSDAGPDGGHASDGGQPSDAGSDAGEPTDAGADAGEPSDAGADGGQVGDGGTDGGQASDGGVDAGSLVLDSVSAHVVGRRGFDVRLTIAANDASKNIAAVMVRLLDSSGDPVLGFDSHQSGVLDSDDGPASFDTVVLGKSTISTTATLAGLNTRAPQTASVAVSLRDTNGNVSNEKTVAVGAQPTLQAGNSCDANYVLNRCPDGLACTGSTPTCQTAAAPQITQLAYLTSDAGPLILISGTEPADNLSNIHIGFEDGGGQPISILLDGDNEPAVSSTDISVVGEAENGIFLVAIDPAPGFDQLCPQIAVTPSDLVGNAGSVKSAKVVATPVLNQGATCSAQGFNVCAANLVCTLNASNAYSCASLTTTQTTACAAAPMLSPVSGDTLTTFGTTSLASLWNAPDGCSSDNPAGRPDGLVSLHLASDTTAVTISTDNPGTNFDTIVYLLPGCPIDSSGSLGCDDDGPLGATSVLSLQDVPAGDYSIVVGSFKESGGTYQLTVQVE